MDVTYIRTLAKEISHRLVTDGIWITGRKAFNYAIGIQGTNPRQDDFDLQRGIYTRRSEPVWMLGIRSPNRPAHGYEAIDPIILQEVLATLGDDRANATFLDLGCGKGRALIVAAEAGFGRVIGVELSAKLASRAKKNIKKMKMSNVEIVNEDALAFNFDIPNLTLYMFNPFGPAVMRGLVAAIQHANNRPKYIVYFNAFHAEFIDALPQYEQIMRGPIYKVWQEHS